jgi:hypothetical protein
VKPLWGLYMSDSSSRSAWSYSSRGKRFPGCSEARIFSKKMEKRSVENLYRQIQASAHDEILVISWDDTSFGRNQFWQIQFSMTWFNKKSDWIHQKLRYIANFRREHLLSSWFFSPALNYATELRHFFLQNSRFRTAWKRFPRELYDQVDLELESDI